MLLVSLWPFSLFLVAPYAAGYFMALFFILCSSLCCWLVYGPFLSFSYWLKYPTFECSFKVFDNVWMEINLPCFLLMLKEEYSLTCIQWSLLGERKHDHIRKLTTYLRSVNPYFQFWSVIICVLMLPEDNLLEKLVVVLCFCNYL